MRGAVVFLRQLFLPPCHFAGETNDHVVFIGLSVNRDGAECSAFDLHGLTILMISARGPDFASAGGGGGEQPRCWPGVQSLSLGIATCRHRYGEAHHPASARSG